MRPRDREPAARLRALAAGRYHIEIIDLVENPHLAAEDQILAVPTLVKKHPPPIRKMVGDLSDTERLLFRLQLQTRPGPADG